MAGSASSQNCKKKKKIPDPEELSIGGHGISTFGPGDFPQKLASSDHTPGFLDPVALLIIIKIQTASTGSLGI